MNVALQVVTVRLPPKVIEAMDRSIKNGLAHSRSEIIRDAVKVRVGKDPLKDSAYADIVRAIIECERFLQVVRGPAKWKRARLYLQRLRDLEGRIAAELGLSDDSAGESAEEG